MHSLFRDGKKDSKVKLEVSDTLFKVPPTLFSSYARVLSLCTRAIFLLCLSPRIIHSRFLVLPGPPYEDMYHLYMHLLHAYHLVCIIVCR